MRLLVLGAGGIGGYFGGRLAAAGEDVTFLVRPRRAAALERDGLVIESPEGNWSGPVKTVTGGAGGGPYDVVLLSCKSYDLASAIDAIKPAVESGALVLPLLNGLNHLDTLDAAFGAEKVLGGVAHISVTLDTDGRIRHLNKLQILTHGARLDSQAEAAARLQGVLARGGFTAVLAPVIMQDMWEKLVMLATLAGMTCLTRASVGEIAATRDGRALMLEMLGECAAVAQAHGHAVRRNRDEAARAMLTDATSRVTASMLRDMQAGGPTEADHIVGDMVARAEAMGMPTPLLRIAYCNLQCYENARRTATTE